MRFWFDTEFVDDGCTIDLISVGIVAEDGRQFYAEIEGVKYEDCGPWVQQNVWPHLLGTAQPRAEVAAEIRGFVGDSPDFWAWFGAYDWVALVQLCWGPLVSKRNRWPHRYHELAQLKAQLGIRDLPPKPVNAHYALADAQWAKSAWDLCHAHRPAEQQRETV